MKKQHRVKEKLTLVLLASLVIIFGFVLPDSLSDHNKMVHFSAHFGMSFLLALCFYMFCTVKLSFSKPLSYTILISATLGIGVLYKYWELATQHAFQRLAFHPAIEAAGVMTSMSQNLSGLTAAILLIEGLVHKNMIMSAIQTGNFHFTPDRFNRLNPGSGSPNPENR